MATQTQTIQSERFAWETSFPVKESGSEVTGRKEGQNLANSVTENFVNFSLMPRYSARQLRTLESFIHGWRRAGSMNDLEQKRKQMLHRRDEILAHMTEGVPL